MIYINRSELNETIKYINSDILFGMARGLQASPKLDEILSRVFPWSVGISFRVSVLGIYRDSLSSYKRLEVTERILNEL
jgi:hypothetical protein